MKTDQFKEGDNVYYLGEIVPVIKSRALLSVTNVECVTVIFNNKPVQVFSYNLIKVHGEPE